MVNYTRLGALVAGTMSLSFVGDTADAANSTRSNENAKYTNKALRNFKKAYGKREVARFLDQEEDSPQKRRLKHRLIENIALEIMAGHKPPAEVAATHFDLSFDPLGLGGQDPLIHGRSGGPPTRSGSSLNTIFVVLEEIWGYGCWCYFGEEYGKGHGPPVNTMDADCQALGLCYQCIEMDLMEEGRSDCFPGMEEYNRPVRKDSSLEGALIACAEENLGDNCKIYTCTCETTFINKLVKNFFAGVVFDPTPKHEFGFDPEEECPYLPSAGPVTKECCGTYPSRSPFGVSNKRKCCEASGRTYNAELYECCADGSVRISC